MDVGGEGEGGNPAHSQVYQAGHKEVCGSTHDFVALGRRAGLGDKKVRSVLDRLSSRCLWNILGRGCRRLELQDRGSKMSIYRACLEACGWIEPGALGHIIDNG